MTKDTLKFEVEIEKKFKDFKNSSSMFKNEINSSEHYLEVLLEISKTIQSIQAYNPKTRIPKMEAIDPLIKNLSFFPEEAVRDIIKRTAETVKNRYNSLPIADIARPMTKWHQNSYNARLAQEQNATRRELPNDKISSFIKEFSHSSAVIQADKVVLPGVKEVEPKNVRHQAVSNTPKISETERKQRELEEALRSVPSVSYERMMGLPDSNGVNLALQGAYLKQALPVKNIKDNRERLEATVALLDNIDLLTRAKVDNSVIASPKHANREKLARTLGFDSEVEQRKFSKTTGIPKENLIEIAKLPNWNAAFKVDNLDNMTPRELQKLQSQMDRLASQGVVTFTDMIKKMSAELDVKKGREIGLDLLSGITSALKSTEVIPRLTNSDFINRIEQTSLEHKYRQNADDSFLKSLEQENWVINKHLLNPKPGQLLGPDVYEPKDYLIDKYIAKAKDANAYINGDNIKNASIQKSVKPELSEDLKELFDMVSMEVGKFLSDQKTIVEKEGGIPNLHAYEALSEKWKDILGDEMYLQAGSPESGLISAKMKDLEDIGAGLRTNDFGGQAFELIDEYEKKMAEAALATSEATRATTDEIAAEKKKATLEEVNAKKDEKLSKLGQVHGFDSSLYKNVNEISIALTKELSKVISDMTAMGKYEDLDKEGRKRYNKLRQRRNDFAGTLNSVNKSLSTQAYYNNQDAMQVSMYTSAYNRAFRPNASHQSYAQIQKQYAERLFRELSSLDLANPIADTLKKVIPNILENAAHTGVVGLGNHVKNKSFNKYVGETEVFKNFKEEFLKLNPQASDRKILKEFNKDKLRQGRAVMEMRQLDNLDGKNRVSEVAKAGNLIGMAAPVAAQAVLALAENIKKLGEQSIIAFENIQALQTQLGVVFSSQGEASNMFQKFADYAVVSPFGVNTMVQQGIQLKQSGVGGSELLDTMKRIGDISSGNQDKMKSISDVYSRVMASTTVTARDMRQLVNAGVPAYDALTKAMQENPNGRNISRSNIRSLLQSGKVTSEDFQLMLKNLTDEGGMFYGATKVGAKTLKARKQNLSDIRELALAAVGESITTGGQDLSSTFYGKLLSVQEHAWTWLRDEFNKGIKTKQVNYQKEKLEKYKRYTDILESTDISDVQKKLISELRGDYNYADYVRAASEYYNANIPKQKVVSDSEYELINEAYNSMKSILAGSYGKDSLDQFNSLRKVNHYANMDFKDIEKLYEDVISQSGYDKKYKKAAEYETEANIVKFSEALTRGSDAVENFIKATDGATSLVTKERQRYDSTSIGSLIKSDEEYLKKAEKKNKMNEFTRIRENDKWVNAIFKRQGDDLTSDDIQLRADGAKYGLTLDKYSEMVKYMAAEQKAMDLTPDAMFKKDVWGNITNEIAEGAQKSWDTLYTNIRNLDRMIEDDDMDRAVKEGLHVYLRDMLATAGGALKKESLETMSNYRKDLEDSVADIKDVKLRNKIEEALNYTFTDITFDNVRQEAINKSGNPHLWAEALSKLTGIASNRVETEGDSKVFNKYMNYLSPKNLSKSLISAMMASTNATLPQIARTINSGKTGKDDRGNTLYNWRSISKDLSQQARESSSAEVRNAYLNGIQEQINALNELTVGSLALGETAEEVRAGLTNMGVAFDYQLERGADGLMRFSDATLQSASAMSELYRIEASNAKISNARKDFEDAAKEKALDASLTGIIASQLSSNVDPEKLKTQKDIDSYLSEISNTAKTISKEIMEGNALGAYYKEQKYVRKGMHYNEQMSFENYLARAESRKTAGGKLTAQEEADLKRLRALRDIESGNNMAVKNPAVFTQLNGISDASGLDYIKGVGENFAKGLKESYHRYVTTGIAEDIRLVFDEGKNPELEKNLKKLRTVDGKENLLKAISDPNTGVEKVSKSIESYLLNVGRTAEETEALTKVLEAFGFSIKGVTGRVEEFNQTEKDANKEKKNTLGWTAFQANLLSKNTAFGGLDETDIDASTKWKYNIITKAGVAEKYFSDMENRKNLPSWLRNGSISFDSTSEYEEFMKNPAFNTLTKGGKSTLRDDIMYAIEETYLKERREQGERLGDYKKAPFLADENRQWLNENVYNLPKYTSWLGANDFIKNNLSTTFNSANTLDALKGKKNETTRGTYEEVAKLLSKAKLNDYGGVVSTEDKKLLEKIANNGFFDKNGNPVKDAKEDFEKLLDIINRLDEHGLSKLSNEMRKITEQAALAGRTVEEQIISNIKNELGDALKKSGIDGYLAMTKAVGKTIGDTIVNAKSFSDIWKNAGQAMNGVLSSLTDQSARLLFNAGLQMIVDGEKVKGFGLIAASGLASIVSGILSTSESDKNKKDDETERLQKIKDNMAELLQQARNDAQYYEMELKNKKAISTNNALSTKSVNDMILTPQGQFSTAPDDYIFAMKHPEDLRGGGSAPVINFNVVNNASGVETRTERHENADGSYDFTTYIDSVVADGISKGRYSDAFAVMQATQNGTQTFA